MYFFMYTDRICVHLCQNVSRNLPGLTISFILYCLQVADLAADMEAAVAAANLAAVVPSVADVEVAATVANPVVTRGSKRHPLEISSLLTTINIFGTFITSD